MIRGAFHHFPGLGPKRIDALRQAGVTCWGDLRGDAPAGGGVGPASWERLCCEARQCEALHQARDVGGLAVRFEAADRWRLLDEFLEETSFFDIETTGLGYEAEITVIACLHRGAVRRFVRGENLEEFADLLDEVRLLASFNGASFDVPFVCRHFRLGSLPCAHVDLRHVAARAGLHGGLKEIERLLSIFRPADLVGVDGADAVRLWYEWELRGRRAARDLLVRYCSADVVALRSVAAALPGLHGGRVRGGAAAPDWSLLDEGRAEPSAASAVSAVPGVSGVSGADSPAARRMREFLRRRRG